MQVAARLPRVAAHAHYLGPWAGAPPVADGTSDALVFTYADSLRDRFWELDVAAILTDAAAAEPLLRAFSARVHDFLTFLEPERWGVSDRPILSRVLAAAPGDGGRRCSIAEPSSRAEMAAILNLGDSPFGLGWPDRVTDLTPKEGCLTTLETLPCVHWGAAGDGVDVAFVIWRSR